MCSDCGCGMTEENHGDQRHILWSQIVAAAEASGVSPQEAVNNMQDMAKKQS